VSSGSTGGLPSTAAGAASSLSRCRAAAAGIISTMPAPLHRPPRHPHAWIVGLLLSQLAVVFVWWRWGWRWACRHAAVAPSVRVGNAEAGFRLFSPVLRRLPTREAACG
jgi:hypothetical protein